MRNNRRSRELARAVNKPQVAPKRQSIESQESSIHEIHVVVTTKPEVPNPFIPKLTDDLKGSGFDAQVIAVGQTIILGIDAKSQNDAVQVAREASEKLLANPIYQQYEIFDKEWHNLVQENPDIK